MPLIIFSFTFDTDSKTGTFAGNIEAVTALQILQGLIYADIEERAKKSTAKPIEKEKPKDE